MQVGKRYRGEQISQLEDNHYIGCDFSHAHISADLSNKRFDNCILFNTDFTESNIDKTTQFNYAGFRNPMTTKKPNGEPLAKFTKEQLQVLQRKEISRWNDSSNGILKTHHHVFISVGLSAYQLIY